MDQTNIVIIIIGILGIITGIYLAISGSLFIEYFSSLFLGITLIGSAYINHKST